MGCGFAAIITSWGEDDLLIIQVLGKKKKNRLLEMSNYLNKMHNLKGAAKKIVRPTCLRSQICLINQL